jgi:predicted nuclease with TOPRIM domain
MYSAANYHIEEVFMSPIGKDEIEVAKEVGQYGAISGVLAMVLRLLWKFINKFGASADARAAVSEAEQTLWKRLQDQIEELQASKHAMEQKIEQMREELLSVKQENSRLMTQNEFYKQKIDEQTELIKRLEEMIDNVRIIDKSK